MERMDCMMCDGSETVSLITEDFTCDVKDARVTVKDAEMYACSACGERFLDGVQREAAMGAAQRLAGYVR